jgi:hypothetical protein
MSFILRGGYDAIRKQVLNISLKRSDKWSQGLVLVQPNMFVSLIKSHNDNKIEIVKYNNTHALLLNENIIYEDEKLFTYKIELEGVPELDINDRNLYDFLDCKYVECYAMKHIGNFRTLN